MANTAAVMKVVVLVGLKVVQRVFLWAELMVDGWVVVLAGARVGVMVVLTVVRMAAWMAEMWADMSEN